MYVHCVGCRGEVKEAHIIEFAQHHRQNVYCIYVHMYTYLVLLIAGVAVYVHTSIPTLCGMSTK